MIEHQFPSIEAIKARVCARFDVRPLDLVSDRRFRAIARPRQVAMYLAQRLTLRSLTQIGRQFGGRDHTTVIHAIRTVEARREGDEDLDASIRAIEAELADQLQTENRAG